MDLRGLKTDYLNGFNPWSDVIHSLNLLNLLHIL